jgi:hypothetical protein
MAAGVARPFDMLTRIGSHQRAECHCAGISPRPPPSGPTSAMGPIRAGCGVKIKKPERQGGVLRWIGGWRDEATSGSRSRSLADGR